MYVSWEYRSVSKVLTSRPEIYPQNFVNKGLAILMVDSQVLADAWGFQSVSIACADLPSCRPKRDSFDK